MIDAALDLAHLSKSKPLPPFLQPSKARSISALDLATAVAHQTPDDIYFSQAKTYAAEDRNMRQALGPLVGKDVYNFASRYMEKPHSPRPVFDEPTLRSELTKLLSICLPGINIGVDVGNMRSETLERTFIYLKKIKKSDVQFASSFTNRAKPYLSQTPIHELPGINSVPLAARALLEQIPVTTSMIRSVDYKAGADDAWRRVHVTLNEQHVRKVMDSKDGAAMLHETHVELHNYRLERFKESEHFSAFSAILNSSLGSTLKKFGMKELLKTDFYLASTRGTHLLKTVATLPAGPRISFLNESLSFLAKSKLAGAQPAPSVRHIKPDGAAGSGISIVSRTGQFFIYADFKHPLEAKTLRALDQILERSLIG